MGLITHNRPLIKSRSMNSKSAAAKKVNLNKIYNSELKRTTLEVFENMRRMDLVTERELNSVRRIFNSKSGRSRAISGICED